MSLFVFGELFDGLGRCFFASRLHEVSLPLGQRSLIAVKYDRGSLVSEMVDVKFSSCWVKWRLVFRPYSYVLVYIVEPDLYKYVSTYLIQGVSCQ